MCCIAFKANSVVTTSYSINGTELTKVTKHCDLGIIFSNNLPWFDHTDPRFQRIEQATFIKASMALR